MAPIYDTDLAESRWADAEWKDFELWENLERKARLRQIVWVALTGVLALLLSAVPVVMDHLPRWKGLAMSRRLSAGVLEVRSLVAWTGNAHRLRWQQVKGKNIAHIEQVGSCGSEVQAAKLIRRIPLGRGGKGGHEVLSAEQARVASLQRVSGSYCLDPLGQGDLGATRYLVTLPVNDLASGRIDRAAMIEIAGGDLGPVSLR
ncbi:MAG: hypothetical protein IT285_11190 [Bdellovibrionales bacterium]|nr:hypothetical protein [Bdellovibrionales bacterium]